MRPSMSYCMWENATQTLQQLVNDLEETYDSLQQYTQDRSSDEERVSIKRVRKQCEKIVELLEDMECRN
jgi:hypothetical protein